MERGQRGILKSQGRRSLGNTTSNSSSDPLELRNARSAGRGESIISLLEGGRVFWWRERRHRALGCSVLESWVPTNCYTPQLVSFRLTVLQGIESYFVVYLLILLGLTRHPGRLARDPFPLPRSL